MNKQKSTARIDWMITLVPLALILALCVLFFFLPEQSNAVLSQIRFFFGDTWGTSAAGISPTRKTASRTAPIASGLTAGKITATL